MKLKSTLLAASLFAFSAPAMADTIMFSDTIDGSEPTFDQPISAAAVETSYDTFSFTVDADGMYSFLSFYAGDTTLDENMDGVLLLYTGAFDPLDPLAGAPVGSDDYSAGGIGALAPFDGACVGSNCSAFDATLTAGTTYVLVQSTFTDVPNSFGMPTGSYDTTITGPGGIARVPVPAAIWLMMSALAGFGALRRR